MADNYVMDAPEKKTWGEWYQDNKSKIFWAIVALAAAAGAYYYWFHYRTEGSAGSGSSTFRFSATSVPAGSTKSDVLGSDDFLRGNEIPSVSPQMPSSGDLKVTRVKFH